MKTYKEKIEAQKEQYYRELKYYKEYILKLKETFFENKEWRNETSPLIISKLNLMKMAYSYAMNDTPRNPYDVNLVQCREWKTENLLNYYVINDDRHSTFSGIPASFVFELKFIKEVNIKLLNKTWKSLVKDDKTNLGYSEWLKKTNSKELVGFIKYYHKENIQCINEPFLKIKDIVVVTP